MERPCIVGRRLRVVRSVSVSRECCFSLSMYVADDLRFLRKKMRRQAAMMAPSKIPGTKPAAKEPPEKWCEESLLGTPSGAEAFALEGDGLVRLVIVAAAAVLVVDPVVPEPADGALDGDAEVEGVATALCA